MIQPITYGGCRWKVTFVYTPTKGACAGQGGPNITHCVIWADVVGGHKLEGWAWRSAADKPSYEIGRKVALTRALEGTDKEFRTAVWKAYLGRKQGQGTAGQGKAGQLMTEESKGLSDGK